MAPIIFITSVSLVLLLMLYWVLRGDGGQRRSRSDFRFETAQELFNYVEDDVYLGENCIQLQRTSEGRVSTYWNLALEKWQEMGGSADPSKRSREPFLRVYQAGDLLHTLDMPLKQRCGQFDFDLPPHTACYCSLGFKENGRFSALVTSRTLMRQC
ncbi:MAG TPA: hypothetical protein VN426_03890 [Syntrophomonadaceae bacterium]|nr:hypothetical protein [Syntrophomonadaceae bacterium]